MYSTYNKGNSVVAERFIRTLKNKTFNHVTVFSKNVYFYVLDDVVNKYNNAVYRTIKMDISSTYVISDLNGEPITGIFYEKRIAKNSQEKFRIEKIILYVKWKGYGNSFNSWINKKDIEINSLESNSIVSK